MRLLGDGWGACPLRSVCGVLLHVPFHVGYVWHASACVELCFPIHNPHLRLELFTAPPEFHRPVSFHLRLELFTAPPEFHRPESFHLRLELFTAPQNSTGLYPSTSAWSCSQRPQNSTSLYPSTSAWSCSQSTQIYTSLHIYSCWKPHMTRPF